MDRRMRSTLIALGSVAVVALASGIAHGNDESDDQESNAPWRKIHQGVLRVEEQGAEVYGDLKVIGSDVEEIGMRQETPPSPAHRAWISPFWQEFPPTGGGLFPRRQAPEIRILNPGEETARVGCTAFDRTGTLLLDRSQSITVGRGALGFCSLAASASEFGWLVLTSDRPVVPWGAYGISDRDWPESWRVDMAFHPVDCGDPEGLEFACQFMSEK